MLGDSGFYVIVLCSGRSDSYGGLKEIIILERAICICILYEFYVKKFYMHLM
jgi:hypothetical protein